MVFMIMFLLWSVIDFGRNMCGELFYVFKVVCWGIDYLFKVMVEVFERMYVQVGDLYFDYNCWEWFEDMDMLCVFYWIDWIYSGFDVVGEIVVVFVVVLIVFWLCDFVYFCFFFVYVIKVQLNYWLDVVLRLCK